MVLLRLVPKRRSKQSWCKNRMRMWKAPQTNFPCNHTQCNVRTLRSDHKCTQGDHKCTIRSPCNNKAWSLRHTWWPHHGHCFMWISHPSKFKLILKALTCPKSCLIKHSSKKQLVSGSWFLEHQESQCAEPRRKIPGTNASSMNGWALNHLSVWRAS